MIGAVPAVTQLALAVGIFFFLPLGDRFGNARLAMIFTVGQLGGVAIMAFADGFRLFMLGSAVLGLFTVTPYLIPAYASKRVDPARLGHAMAVLTTGVIGGILIARLGSGLIGEYFGWRSVYLIAGVLMAAVTLVLPVLMRQGGAEPRRDAAMSYPGLIASSLPLAWRHPKVLLSGSIQGLNFGIFMALWLGIGLHLPDIGYGVDVVGWMAGIAIFNLATTPRLGAWSDRVGPERARSIMAMVQNVAIAAMFFAGSSPWLMLVPLMANTVVGPVIDITGRATFLGEDPAIRTRLMTVFIMLMFAGGGFGSWAGTAAYAAGGWTGTCILAMALSVSVSTLSQFALRRARSVTA